MDFSVSTQTFVVYSQDVERVNLEDLYSKIVLSDTIIGIRCGANSAGVSKRTATAAASSVNYLKCLTLSVLVPCANATVARKTVPVGFKSLSIKVFRNGSIQVTGCKSELHVKCCVEIVYNLLGLKCVAALYLVSVMINANFAVGFKINRERLCKYLESVCKINIPPLTNGYMGTKLKIPLMKDVKTLQIPCYSWTTSEGFARLASVGYLDYFAQVSKKCEKRFMACIGIFQNGKVLVSSVDRDAIAVVCQWAWTTLKTAQPLIQVKFHEPRTFRRD